MHWKTTLLLMVCVCILGCFIWIVEWKPNSEDDPRHLEKKLLSIKPETVSYLSFHRNGTFIECMNEDGQWMINRPIHARADNGSIHRLLAIMEMLPLGEIITASERQARELTFKDYGLTKSSARVVLGDSEKRYKLTIGAESPLKDAVYVQLDNSESVKATSTNVLNVIPNHVDDVRDTRLLQGSPLYVTRIQIKRHDGPMIQLVKEGAEWILHQPLLARADWIKVSRLLEHLFSMRIRQFVSETMADPAAYGLSDDEAILRVSIWQSEEQNGEKLLFGKNANEKGDLVYATCKDSSSIYAVDKDTVQSVQANVNDFRDSRLYFMPEDEIAFVRLEMEGKVLQLHKGGETGWRIVEPKQWPANSRAVASLVNRLNTLRITPFMEKTVTNLHAVGLDKPARVIRVADSVPLSRTVTQGVEQITLPPGKTKRSLRLSAPMPGKEYVFAQFEDERQIYQISASSASTFSIDPLTYRDTTVLTLDPSMIRSITLKKNGVEQTVEKESSGSWKPIKPASGEVNMTVIRDILDHVAELTVLRFEGSDITNLSVYGLKDAKVSLTFRLTGEEGIQKSLIIGQRSEDLGMYAMLQGQDVVFVIEGVVVGSLIRDLIH